MNYKKLNLIDIKNFIFKQQFKRFPYLKQFKKNPYTYLKARYYMYLSSILVYYLLKTRITPNMVTVVYGLSGILGGILFSIPNLYCNIAGIIIFFNKGVLDWSDGHLARIKFKTTLKGHILDVYGAYLNTISFNVGLGFFVYHQTNQEFLIYLISTIVFLLSGLPTILGKNIILNELRVIKIKKLISNHNINYVNNKKSNKKIKYSKWILFFKDFLDDRARSVDFILLIMIMDIFFNNNFSFYLFLTLYFKNFIRFLLLFFSGIKSNWAENSIMDIKKINYEKN